MKDQVLVKYKNGDIRYVGKNFYLDRYWMFTLVDEDTYLKGEEEVAPVVPKDKEEEEIEKIKEALKVKGISFHPNSKIETLKKKLEG